MRKFQINSVTFPILGTVLLAFCYHFSSTLAQDGALSIATNNTNNFILRLIKEQNDDDFLFSPIALEIMLSLIRSGGDPASGEELDNVLPQSRGAFKDFLERYTNNNVLNITQRIYVLQGYTLNPQFRALSVDYLPNTQDVYVSRARPNKAMNDWTKSHKNKVSANTLSINLFTRMSPLEIINVVQFKNDWLMPFDKSRTSIRNFHFNHANNKKIAMMHRHDYYLFADMPELNATALRMYYKNNASMLILLPRSRYGLPELVTSLTLDMIEILNNRMEMTDVRVSLPKFRVNAFQMSLEKLLKAVGVRRIFSADVPLDQVIYQYGSIHLHGIEALSSFRVDELGTDIERDQVKSTPGKGAEIQSKPIMPATHLTQTFNVNKPFLYIIQHSIGTPLLVGSYYGDD